MFSVTQLSKKHCAFDALAAELESDEQNSADLVDAGEWVADTFYTEEGETIRTARMRLGLSQTKLAAALETSQPQVAKIESGRVDLQHSTLVKLQKALGIDANTLFAMIERQEQQKAAK